MPREMSEYWSRKRIVVIETIEQSIDRFLECVWTLDDDDECGDV